MNGKGCLLCLAVLWAITAGCRSEGVVGGTTGRLRSEGKPIEGVRLSIDRIDGGHRERVGFGVSQLDGSFRLYQEGAAGPLWLTPGEYSVTLESEGTTVREWPGEFSDPVKTPLKINWSGTEKSLELEIPPARIRYQ